jgi:NAD(P)-dependent dehydrogenase (short-subunit alcohol dehydrogenase family)
VDQLRAAAAGRPVDTLLANARHGFGHGFLDQDFEDARHAIDTNVTGTIYLVQLVGRAMRSRGKGRILLTGSIARFMPGTYQPRPQRHQSLRRFPHKASVAIVGGVRAGVLIAHAIQVRRSVRNVIE